MRRLGPTRTTRKLLWSVNIFSDNIAQTMNNFLLFLVIAGVASLMILLRSLRKAVMQVRDIISEQLRLQSAVLCQACPAFDALELAEQFRLATEWKRRLSTLQAELHSQPLKPPISPETRERMREVSE